MKQPGKKQQPRSMFYSLRVWFLVAIIFMGLGYGGAKLYLDQQKVVKIYSKQVYGTWVEQNVAGYAADSFTITTEGVFIEERLVSSRYDFDGVTLEFSVGGQIHRFEVVNAAMTKLKRTAPAHYESVFINTNPPPPLEVMDAGW